MIGPNDPLMVQVETVRNHRLASRFGFFQLGRIEEVMIRYTKHLCRSLLVHTDLEPTKRSEGRRRIDERIGTVILPIAP